MAKEFSSQKFELHKPEAEEIITTLQDGLSANFKEVSVKLVQCPDLTLPPFHLAAPGLCGDERIADIGGPPYLLPHSQHKEKVYSFPSIARQIELADGVFMIGAGAGPAHVVGVNSELMPNIYISDKTSCNKTHFAKVDEKDASAYSCSKLSSDECCLMCNLYCSRGRPGQVIEVLCGARLGEDNFISCMRSALAAHYKERPVAMGGVFLIESGQAKLHVMPDFSSEPLDTSAKVDGWLKFYEMSAPLVCLTEFVSHDPGLDLRVEHTHCFSEHNAGGHYHYDVTPQEVRYRAYLNIASVLYRIDRPPDTNQLGR